MRVKINPPNKTEAGNLFIARQPIFDKDKNVYAYQLLYRSDAVNRAYIADHKYATLKVMGNSLLIGLQKLTSGKRAYIHFNRELLLARVPFIFPKGLLGVVVGEMDGTEEEHISICTELKKAGYHVVLDDYFFKKKTKTEMRRYLGLADMVTVDFRSTTGEERERLAAVMNASDVRLLAKKIESEADYDEALSLDFHYWQGFLFQKPMLISRQEMPGYKVNYLRILKKIHEPSPDIKGIEEIVKRDVSLTYKLLRFINSASYGFRVTIRSIGHAFALLGHRELSKWLTIIVMSGIGQEKTPELLNTAVIRARLCELIAERFKLRREPWAFFLMGMLSLADALLNRPMAEILEELPLDENVKAALLGRDEVAGEVLKMVEAYEKGKWETFTDLADKMNMDYDAIAALYVESVEWIKFLSS
ncbi:MAG: HDOD domain-containing protein [bacterium]|nr:HDOD domain-containing protein [bacterium]